MEEKAKILVVEDDMETLSKVYIELLYKDFRVEATNDSEELLSRFDRFRPDLLIISRNLRGFDPVKICDHIKKKNAVPVILLSGEEDKHNTRLNGCEVEGIISRPVDLKEMLEKINALLLFD